MSWQALMNANRTEFFQCIQANIAKMESASSLADGNTASSVDAALDAARDAFAAIDEYWRAPRAGEP